MRAVMRDAAGYATLVAAFDLPSLATPSSRQRIS